MSDPGPAASSTTATAASRGPSCPRLEPCPSLPASSEPLPEPPAGFLPLLTTTYAATPPPTASTARIATISAARLFCGTGYCAGYTPELGVATIGDGPDGLVAMIVGPVAPIITGPVIGVGVGTGVRWTMW